MSSSNLLLFLLHLRFSSFLNELLINIIQAMKMTQPFQIFKRILEVVEINMCFLTFLHELLEFQLAVFCCRSVFAENFVIGFICFWNHFFEFWNLETFTLCDSMFFSIYHIYFHFFILRFVDFKKHAACWLGDVVHFKPKGKKNWAEGLLMWCKIFVLWMLKIGWFVNILK